MRLAILIISLIAFLLLLLQSCAVGVGATFQASESLKEGAAIGAALALVYVLGAAFVIGFPIVSAILFAIGAILAIPAGSQSEFTDLTIWGWVAAVLAGLSVFGFFEKRRKRRLEESRSNIQN